ncbi:MAG: helix-turn-helix transcriptional regulator [Planctomycetota bacterium]
MEHLDLLLYLLMLMAGTASTVYLCTFIRKRSHRFLRDLLFYVLSSMGLSLVLLIFKYIHLNLLDLEGDQAHPLSLTTGYFLAMSAEAGMAVAMTRCMLDLRQTTLARPWLQIVEGVFVLFGLTFIWAVATLFYKGEAQWIVVTYRVFFLLMMFCVILASLFLVLPSRKPEEAARKRLTRSLGCFYITAEGLVFITMLAPESARGLVINVLTIGVFLIPLIWCRLFYRVYAQALSSRQSTSDLDSVMTAMVEQNLISRREREIIERIVEGKSNKEIKADLNIAYSTVKNHLYNIYQKLDVSSRAQLIHRLLSERNR